MLEADLVVPPPDWYLEHVLLAGERRPWDLFWDGVAARLRAGGACEQRAAQQGFVLTCAQARQDGPDPASQRRLLYRGTWWQPRRGVVAPFALPLTDATDRAQVALAQRRQHVLTAAAAVLARRGQVISARSAAVLRGLPTFAIPAVPELGAGPDLRPGRGPRAHLWAATLAADDVDDWYGAAVTAVARTVVDCARHDRLDGIMAADAALHDGLATEAELEKALERAAGWPFVRRARGVIELADGRAESPLESLTRLRIADSGLPVPDLQVWIEDSWTGRRYRVDGLWADQGLVLEVDGRDKYSRAELQRQVGREHALRRLGYRIVRVMWEDVVTHWPRTAARLVTELNLRAPAAFTPRPTRSGDRFSSDGA